MTKPAANRSVPAFITAAMDRIRTLWLLVVHPDTWTKSIKLIDCLAQILLTMAADLPEHGLSHRREPPVLLRILYLLITTPLAKALLARSRLQTSLPIPLIRRHIWGRVRCTISLF